MFNLIPLSADPRAIPGVASVEAVADGIEVEFVNGTYASVLRSPLSKFSRRESFDVWLPPSSPGMAADVAASRSANEVLALLNELAAKAAAH